jgi:NAD(P)-dependent dehydrogenase (short-subunit alcohol dehydrogenase family)
MVRVVQAVDGLLARGSVVMNISSVLSSGSSAGEGFTGYVPAKRFQNALTLQIAAALRSRGAIVVALHPGWVATEIGGFGAPTSPSTSARAIVRTSLRLSTEDTGTFIDYDGRPIPW